MNSGMGIILFSIEQILFLHFSDLTCLVVKGFLNKSMFIL